LLSRELTLCSKEHTHSFAVFNNYNTDLFMAWTYEIFHELSQLESQSTYVFDLSNSGYDYQVSYSSRFFREIQRMLSFSKFEQSTVIVPSKILKLANTILVFPKFARIFLRIIKYQNMANFIDSSQTDEYLRKSVHSTVAGYTGTVEYSIYPNLFKIARTLLSFLVIFKTTNDKLKDTSFCEVFIPNGRIVNSAATAAAVRNLGITTTIIERGARPGKFELFDYSPHSAIERRSHLENTWDKTDWHDRARLAREYIELRRDVDPISGVAWTRNMSLGALPKFDSRKLCVIYTSTELEFAVFGDCVPLGNFSVQKEAVKALIDALDPDDWQVIVRRHPYKTKVSKDPERRNWEFLSSYPNVVEIRPDSPVDSYALGQVATLVAHYDSSIGPELIATQKTPVISVGNVFWEDSESQYLINSHSKVESANFGALSVRNIEDIYPWALYMSTFGKDFSKSIWNNSQSFVNGRRIVEKPIAHWLRK